MPLTLSWQQIAFRLALALVASFIIGLNRDEQGKSAGLRTTMLVCLAATLAMMQANILLPTSGKTSSSFGVLDFERLPLGILSGIGFIGAGAILRRGRFVTGLTTAATLWVVTVLGLLFGAGELILGSVGSAVVFLTLWGLRHVEQMLHAERSGTLWLRLDDSFTLGEQQLRTEIASSTCRIVAWAATFDSSGALRAVRCDVQVVAQRDAPPSPDFVHRLAESPSVARLKWRS
jgi:putative Mg2+ transporter-C (MgtC) family protein